MLVHARRFNWTLSNSSEQMQWGAEATGKSDVAKVGLLLPSTRDRKASAERRGYSLCQKRGCACPRVL